DGIRGYFDTESVSRATASRSELGVREEPQPWETQWGAAACSPLWPLSPFLLAGRLCVAARREGTASQNVFGDPHWSYAREPNSYLPSSCLGGAMREQKGQVFHKGQSWFVRYCLGGQVKTGQLGSLQKRPTDVAQDLVLLSCFLLIGQVHFCSPAPRTAF